MSSYYLTPAGVVDKLDELYDLSDPDLIIQADDIADDFRGWVASNFILTPQQATYVASIASSTADYFGDQCSICFRFRLPITLVYPPPPTTAYTKWTGSESTVEVFTDGNGNTEAIGALTFIVTYR